MRKALLLKQLARRAFEFSRSRSSAIAPAPAPALTSLFSRSFSEGIGFSHGLYLALAGKGIIVKENVFHNLDSTELQGKGATIADQLSGLPIYVRGNASGGALEITKAQFSKLLKLVTAHISSISNVFVQDGAVGSSTKCNAKVRIISDSPTVVLSLSNVLWPAPTRAVSHDSCPLTVYVATTMSPGVGEGIGLRSQANAGFLAADIERSLLILCGKAFADIIGVRDALAAAAAPIISARGGIPLPARFLLLGDSVIMLFASEDTVRSCRDLRKIPMLSHSGVILSPDGVSPFFHTKDFSAQVLKMPSSVILVSADSSGTFPPASKLSPGQTAYHFLAGYQNGKFIPGYNKGPSPIDALELSKALFEQLKENQIPPFLVNATEGGKYVTGKALVKLMEDTFSTSVPSFNSRGVDIEGKYKRFLSSRYQVLPEEFSF